MKFNVNKSIEILEKTPMVLSTLLSGISDDWISNNEGGDSWSPFDVVGHLIHWEEADLIPHIKNFFIDNEGKVLEHFDRFAMFERTKGKSLSSLLDDFAAVRSESMVFLRNLKIDENKLSKKGVHSLFPESTFSELLATWTVHDLGHISQITRVMAKQYKNEVGPWIEHLPVLTR